MIGENTISFIFHFIFCTSSHDFFFCLLHFISCHFISFLTTINLLMIVSVRKYCCKFLIGIMVFKFGGRLAFFILKCFLPFGNVFLYYTLRKMCNSSLGVFKERHIVCLFVCFYLSICSKKKTINFFFIKNLMLLSLS
jgi:hypothetical protein